MMNTVYRPPRDEHRQLLPHVDQLRLAADHLGTDPLGMSRTAVTEAHRFLVDYLLPHARAEEAVLYPAIERLLRAPLATATMRHDHVEISRLTEDLGWLLDRFVTCPATTDLLLDVRPVLYGLHTLIRAHFAKEEEIFFPLLAEHLTSAEIDGLCLDMETATREAIQSAPSVRMRSSHGRLTSTFNAIAPN
jgi:iron-sulfur cluster repair protein YtfE (RIC family)